MEASTGHFVYRRPSSPKPRKFYEKSIFPASVTRQKEDSEAQRFRSQAIAANVHRNLIGDRVSFHGPFGERPIVYCDHIASGKSVRFIEEFISKEVLAFYANTHTTTTVTGLQTSMFRDEARDILRNASNASETDAIIFTGSGTTGAIHKLIQAIRPRIRRAKKTIVIASLMEHHSNLLPWRDEENVQVVTIGVDSYGRIDIRELQSVLVDYAKNDDNLIIGTFCAASNVSGILNDDLAITALLHQYGALSFWDYATAAPYVKIDMNPVVPEDKYGLLAKDAIFFSAHKFVGGPGSPGVLIAKKNLFQNPVPDGCGGGTVFYVRKQNHRYLQEIELREEGGTPDIVGAIRAGLALQLKSAVGASFMLQREEQFIERLLERKIDNLYLFGNHQSLDSLAIFSFVVKHPESGLYLHHNFVCALLNDLFGIQARGGCACAGPYVQYLLGMKEDLSKTYEELLAEDFRLDRHHLRRKNAENSSYEVLRPGFARLSLSWFLSDEEADFVIKAVEMVCRDGWRLLPQYRFNNETGEWKHIENLEYKERIWLGNVFYDEEGNFCMNDKYPVRTNDLSFKEILDKAQEVFDGAKKVALRKHVPDQRLIFDDAPDAPEKGLRWFVLPFEAKMLLTQNEPLGEKLTSPFEVLIPDHLPDEQQRKPVGSYNGNIQSTKDLSVILNGGRLRKTFSLSEVRKEPENIIDENVYDNRKSVHRQNDEDNVVDNEKPHQNHNSACPDGVCLPSAKRSPLDDVTLIKSQKSKWQSPPKEIFRPFLEGMKDFEMIKNGDKLLVCLSGGKDSLSLLHCMRQYQFYAKKEDVHFELGAVTVDPLSSAYDPRPLIPYLEQLGVPYLYEQQNIIQQALEVNCSSICAFCSRMKRGRIYAAARREGYNVLAMGQHLDDLAESFFMSVFHNGRLRTMKANYTVKEGDLRVIRPFVYVRERHLRSFAESRKLPIITENCPACFENAKERHRTKQVLAHQELLFPRLYWSLKSALVPLMNIRRTGVEGKLYEKLTLGERGLKTIVHIHSSEDDDEVEYVSFHK